MSTEDAAIGFDSPPPRSRMPYSVSTPQTFRIATRRTYRPRAAMGLQVLPGGDPLNRAAAGRFLALVLRHQGPDVDDPLPLLAGDLGPVVGVGGVGQVLVLLVLLGDRRDEVVGADPRRAAADPPLDCQLLRPAHDVLDHGPRREVLEVHDLLVTVLIRDLQEPVGV